MYKMKFKFIYLAFFTSLLFLFANGRDANKKTTENFYSNDYEVHFVVHKTKKAKTENFLERKKKQIQKKVKRLVEKYDEIKKKKRVKWPLIVLSILLFGGSSVLWGWSVIFGLSTTGLEIIMILSIFLFITMLAIPGTKKEKPNKD